MFSFPFLCIVWEEEEKKTKKKRNLKFFHEFVIAPLRSLRLTSACRETRNDKENDRNRMAKGVLKAKHAVEKFDQLSHEFYVARDPNFDTALF